VERDLSYFTSEQFIHDDLALKAERLAEEMRVVWRKNRKVDSYAITWPSETLQTDDNSGQVNKAVLMRIPDDFDERQKLEALQRMVERTKAYGIALIERRGDELRVLFETHHGARAWLIPLERHGDIFVPGETRVRDNAECLGLLWRPLRGTS
jgi:hypothetical protein